jgi:hypothetical protein
MHPKTSPSSHAPVSEGLGSRKGGGGGSPKALDVVGATGLATCSCLGAPNILDRLKDTGLAFTASSTDWLSASLSLTGVVCGTGRTGSTSSIVPSLVTSGDMLTPNLAVLSFLTLRASGAGEKAWLDATDVNA